MNLLHESYRNAQRFYDLWKKNHGTFTEDVRDALDDYRESRRQLPKDVRESSTYTAYLITQGLQRWSPEFGLMNLSARMGT